MQSLIVAAPAKINLFLGVGALRPDGYHTLTSVFQALELSDTVRLTPSDELTLTCDTNLDIPGDKNLAYLAAQVFARAFEVDVLVDIELSKVIPVAAGLGGGSADAAAVLAGLAHWAEIPLDNPALVNIARALGADCAFALVGGAALMGGRGDELVRTLPTVQAHVALVKPDQPVPTATAFRAFDTAPQAVGDVRRVTDALRHGDAAALGAGLANNMTPVSSALVPDIAEALALAQSTHGVLGAAMAGSGSAVFAICEDAASAQAVVAAAQLRGWWSCATQTSESGVMVTGEEECS